MDVKALLQLLSSSCMSFQYYLYLFQQCSKLIDVFLLYIIQKLEVDGSETDEPVGFIDVYQVKKSNDLILIIVILITVFHGQIQG